MKLTHVAKLALSFSIAVLLIVLLEGTALSQCSMCRASLAGSNNSFFIRNFNIGVLVLLAPPVAIFCSIFVILKRHRGSVEVGQNERSK